MQNFLPKPGTKMHDAPACDPMSCCTPIALARLVLGGAMHVQAPPNLTDADGLGDLIAAGIDDWGGVSPLTADHVNPERPWPALELLRGATEAAGKVARTATHRLPRVRARPRTVARPRGALPGAVRERPRRAGP